jgi:hypothetical protein
MGGSSTADMCLQRYTAVCGEHAHSATSTRWPRQTRRVQNVEEVRIRCCTCYLATHVGSRYITGLAHSALCMRSSSIIFMHNLYQDYNQWAVIFDYSSVDGFHTELYMNVIFCAVYCVLMRHHTQSPQPTWMGTGKSLCYLKRQRLCQNCR